MRYAQWLPRSIDGSCAERAVAQYIGITEKMLEAGRMSKIMFIGVVCLYVCILLNMLRYLAFDTVVALCFRSTNAHPSAPTIGEGSDQPTKFMMRCKNESTH